MLFSRRSAEKKVLSGRNSYSEVERLIRESRELLIVSPYIDEYYARFLASHSGGRKITVLSSSLDEAAKRIIGRSFSAYSFALFIFAGIAELSIGILFSAYVYALAAVVITLLSGYLLSWKSSGIRLKVPKRFIHAKMYVSDKEAITGSANLTYRGMHKNVEMIEILGDKPSVDKLREEFWKMWKDYP
jgi:phosphatidylserine/phosphatidylglycerophosphate/cardiolipin synthase-like enzyme